MTLLEAGLLIGESADLYRQGLLDAIARYREVGSRVAVDEFFRLRWPDYAEHLDRTLPGAFEQAVADAATCFEVDLPGGLTSELGEAEARRVAQPTLVVLGGGERRPPPALRGDVPAAARVAATRREEPSSRACRTSSSWRTRRPSRTRWRRSSTGTRSRPSDYHRVMVSEAPLEETEAGLVPAGEGWFVLNARDAAGATGRAGRCDGVRGTPQFAQVGVRLTSSRPARRWGCTTGRRTRRTSSCSPARRCC